MFISVILGLSVVTPYYYNSCIHNMGNIGPMGAVHAALAPAFTKLIDQKAYNGVNVREEIYNDLNHESILDMCCGTGFSTKPGTVGLDTSKEMIQFAKMYNPGRKYILANAEDYGEDNSYDVVTCMFAFHEMPNYAHVTIVENAKRIAREKVVIVDISTSYKPSPMMLSGEPYILNYLVTIDSILEEFDKKIIVPNHVDMWELNLK